MDNPLDLPRLIRVCEAATPGPWEAHRNKMDYVTFITNKGAMQDVAEVIGTGQRNVDNAAYIAECNPSTILSLLHRLQAAEKRVGELSFDNSIKCFMGDQPMVCEEHPWLQYPHDDCIGPGMPLSAIEDEIKAARERKAP